MWGGYTFDPNLFPSPSDTLEWVHLQGPRVAMNVHDCDGVNPFDDKFVDFCKYLDLDPNKTLTIPF